MDHDDWKAATDCKSKGSWNLHQLLPKDLDFFVRLGSASGIVDLQGQAKYAAGNTYMDALARYRVAQGRKAVSLDLGVMTDDGFLAENAEFLKRVLAYGAFKPITREYFHALLDYYCNPDLPLLTAEQSQCLVGLGHGVEASLDDGVEVPSQVLFRQLRQSQDTTSSVLNAIDEAIDHKIVFSQSDSLVHAERIVSDALVKKLSRTMSIVNNEMDLQKPLSVHDVDSLLAVELRSWMAKEFGADVPVFEILGGSSTLVSLSTSIATKSKLKHAPWVE